MNPKITSLFLAVAMICLVIEWTSLFSGFSIKILKASAILGIIFLLLFFISLFI